MAKTIVVTSGKGGVGKTTTSASVAAGLAQRGFRAVAVDFDMGLRNLDLIMGCESRVVYDLYDVVHGHGTVKQALIKDKRVDGLFVMPASQTRDKDSLTSEGVGRVLDELRESFDYIICDSPAGIEQGALMALYHADEAFIVVNPEVSSVRDSDQILRYIASKSQRAESGDEPVKQHLILTRYAVDRVNQGEMLSVDDVMDILGIPVLGVVPESAAVLQASNSGLPVILEGRNQAAKAYQDVVGRYLGEDIPFHFHTQDARKGFFKRLFGT